MFSRNMRWPATAAFVFSLGAFTKKQIFFSVKAAFPRRWSLAVCSAFVLLKASGGPPPQYEAFVHEH
jgi:hypothetical protein